MITALSDELFTVVLYGYTLRVLECEGQRWLCGHDLAPVFEYRSHDTLSRAYTRGKSTLEGHSIKAYIGSGSWPVRHYNENALRYLCDYSKRPGAFHLLRWLDAGGLQADGPIETPTTGPASAPEAEPVPPVVADPVPEQRPEPLRLVSSLPIPLPFNQELEREKAYCRDLIRVLVRYCDATEVDDLTSWIDARIDDLLRTRDCRGLNDARYDLYCKYWLKGGGV
jgi:hypothetical protein